MGPLVYTVEEEEEEEQRKEDEGERKMRSRSSSTITGQMAYSQTILLHLTFFQTLLELSPVPVFTLSHLERTTHPMDKDSDQIYATGSKTLRDLLSSFVSARVGSGVSFGSCEHA